DTFIASETFVTTLMPGDSVNYTFTTPFNIPRGMAYRIKVWAGISPRFDDISVTNDTARKSLGLPMAGIYTVSGQWPNFGNIAEAIASLDLAGSSAAVTFDFRPTVDTTHSSLYLSGSPDGDPVTFRSESGQASDVILGLGGIDGAYISLENISI